MGCLRCLKAITRRMSNLNACYVQSSAPIRWQRAINQLHTIDDERKRVTTALEFGAEIASRPWRETPGIAQLSAAITAPR